MDFNLGFPFGVVVFLTAENLSQINLNNWTSHVEIESSLITFYEMLIVREMRNAVLQKTLIYEPDAENII